MARIPYVRLIREFAERTPERVAIVLDDESITCEQLERRSNRLARAYSAQGVREGDFVSICLPNCAEYFDACIAAWKTERAPTDTRAQTMAMPAAWIAPLSGHETRRRQRWITPKPSREASANNP